MKVQAMHKKGLWLHVFGTLLKLVEFNEKAQVKETRVGRKVTSREIELEPVEKPFAILINPVDILALRDAGEPVTNKTPAGIRGFTGHIHTPEGFTYEEIGETFVLIDGVKVPFVLDEGYTNQDADGNARLSPKTGKPRSQKPKMGTPAGEGIPVVWNGEECKLSVTVTQAYLNGLNIFATVYPKTTATTRTAFRDESALVDLSNIGNLFAEV